jgi:hypothetical protein
MTSEEKRDYAVGYGRPPQATQFKKGQSGNAKGRPKGSKSLIALCVEELNERIVVKENGQRKSITKRKAAVKQLVNKALSGDFRSLKLLAQELKTFEDEKTSESSNHAQAVESVRERVIERLERLRKRMAESDYLLKNGS